MLPHPTLLATGVVLGAVALVAVASLRPIHRLWVLPALVGTAMVVAPGIGMAAAFASWDVTSIEGAALVVLASVGAGAVGALAAVRCSPTACLAALAGVAAAMVAGVPDTEASVLLAGALVVFAAAPLIVEVAVPPPAAAAAAVGVMVTGMHGATGGGDTGVGALGTVLVLGAVVALRRPPPTSLPGLAVAPLSITVGAAVAGRLTAGDLEARPLGASILATIAATAAVIRVLGDRLAPPPPQVDPGDEAQDRGDDV